MFYLKQYICYNLIPESRNYILVHLFVGHHQN